MLNKVVLMGRLTRDPELKQSNSGTSICTFSLAVDRSYVKNGEDRQTDFINILAFGSTAEFVWRYFRKGQLAALVGRIQMRRWQDQSGNNRTAFEVIAEEMSFAGDKKEMSLNNNYSNKNNESQTFSDAAPYGFSPDNSDDSDLPF